MPTDCRFCGIIVAGARQLGTHGLSKGIERAEQIERLSDDCVTGQLVARYIIRASQPAECVPLWGLTEKGRRYDQQQRETAPQMRSLADAHCKELSTGDGALHQPLQFGFCD